MKFWNLLKKPAEDHRIEPSNERKVIFIRKASPLLSEGFLFKRRQGSLFHVFSVAKNAAKQLTASQSDFIGLVIVFTKSFLITMRV
ncbi:hypothetical protein Zmor_016390 [Zophobas morio]|jgi:hypothetical protein|uniref:Uncharacterized protein n=1 Tax=Zophobas morio TaxID=2755281 RepID=A0AA38LZC1_9CUCU|nr:hypothetical protein Zmor_016390 [Zophobas morio]